MTDPFPFVVGSPRSGTTLLRVMLDAHPDLAVPGESYFVVGVYRALPQVSRSFDLEAFTGETVVPSVAARVGDPRGTVP